MMTHSAMAIPTLRILFMVVTIYLSAERWISGKCAMLRNGSGGMRNCCILMLHLQAAGRAPIRTSHVQLLSINQTVCLSTLVDWGDACRRPRGNSYPLFSPTSCQKISPSSHFFLPSFRRFSSEIVYLVFNSLTSNPTPIQPSRTLLQGERFIISFYKEQS